MGEVMVQNSIQSGQKPVDGKSIIQIKDLRYRYRGGKRYALDGIDLELNQGTFLMVMGPSEAGKSTLAASLNGLIPHFYQGKLSGDVDVMGKNTRQFTVAQMAENVGMVFQDFEAQLFSTNVELEVAFGPENYAIPREEIVKRIDESLKLVGLENMRNRSPSTLSGGQKQKLAIASVLAMHTPILVMDEPTTDLDPISKLGVFEIAYQLKEREDITLIVVEHETEEALQADELCMIKDGKIVRMGPARELLRDVDLFEQVGVMPLGIPRYFKQMGVKELPLTPEEGIREFQAQGWSFSDKKYQELVVKDEERSRKASEVLIHCEDLELTYPNGFKALHGISMDIHKGEMVAILGQNGSGKTTLVKNFNGLLFPTAGKIEVQGKPTQDQGVFQLGKKVGYVFQNPDYQIFSETVFDEVAFTLRLRKVGDDAIKKAVSESLEAVGLAGFEKEDPFSLTKSGRQRVAVASVLAAQPEIIILDEPTTGLDYAEQHSMMNLVKELNERGNTVIFVTHHMWVVAEYAQRVFVIKDGRIYLQGTTREVFSHEEELREASLRPPHLVSFSNHFGKTMLTVDELVYCSERG
jgi:energy-coupling factor transporter ATP-binding protein EcfA2